MAFEFISWMPVTQSMEVLMKRMVGREEQHCKLRKFPPGQEGYERDAHLLCKCIVWLLDLL